MELKQPVSGQSSARGQMVYAVDSYVAHSHKAPETESQRHNRDLNSFWEPFYRFTFFLIDRI